MKKTGVLLINLGTPEAPTVKAVRRYLREFLSDPYVIDIPALARWLLLNLIILPFRTKQSTEAYQKIWTEEGSPLLVNSRSLAKKLQVKLGDAYHVTLAMRYGSPSLESAIKELVDNNVNQINIIPLYPQYAESTTKSSLLAAKKIIQQQHTQISVNTLNDFFNHPSYIESSAQLIKSHLAEKNYDKLIFSYHGLPERHINTVCHEKSNCNLKKPCPSMMSSNELCYRAQCYATSRHIANKLGLRQQDYLVCFQSRLGKTPWITPYTDTSLEKLAEQGVKNIAIVCPSFIADCLETLEEIDIRAKEQWQSLGGQHFIRIPCLNDDENWVSTLQSLIDSHPNIQPDILTTT